MKSTKQFLRDEYLFFWARQPMSGTIFCFLLYLLVVYLQKLTNFLQKKGQKERLMRAQRLARKMPSLLYPKGQWIPATVRRTPAGDLTLLCNS